MTYNVFGETLNLALSICSVRYGENCEAKNETEKQVIGDLNWQCSIYCRLFLLWFLKQQNDIKLVYDIGVRTDPGKVWKVLEFNVEIFKALKSLENDCSYGKVWKNP